MGSDPALLATIAWVVFAILLFAAMVQFISDGANSMRQSFINELRSGLSETFIFLDARMLVILYLVGLSIVCAIGFWLLGVVGVILGFLLVSVVPRLIINYMKQKRTEKFLYQLPDALATLSSSLRAGSNLMRGLEQIITQQPAPISQEFSIVVSDYKMGRSLEEALTDLHRRVPRQEVDLMVTGMVISKAVGGNLADALISLSDTIREKSQMEGKIRALTSMGKLQGWVVGALPFFVGALLFTRRPEMMVHFFYDPIGWVIIGAILGMTVLAMWWIRKIVNIDV